MNTFKAVKILSKFLEPEWKDFREYLDGNGNPQIQELLALLFKNKKSLPMDKDEIISKIPRLEGRLDDLMNKLLNHIQDFLVNTYSNPHSETKRAEKILSFYSERNLPDEFEAYYRKTENIISEAPPVSAYDHLVLYEYYKTIAIHEKIHEGRESHISIPLYEAYLDIYYWIEKLKIMCEKLNRARLTNELIDVGTDRFHFDISASENLSKRSIILFIYRELFWLLTEEKNLSLGSLESIMHNLEYIPFTEATLADTLTISHYLINLSLQGMKHDEDAYGAFFISLIDFMEAKNILLQNRVIEAPIFKLAMSIGIKMDATEWVDRFYNTYLPSLSSVNRVETTKYFKALILYHNKEYKPAGVLLNDLKKLEVDQFFRINTRMLEIKIYIDENPRIDAKDQLLKSLLAGLKNILGKQTNISLDKREGSLKWIDYIQKILSAQKISFEQISKEIDADKTVSDKKWLLSLIKRRRAR